MKPDHVENFSLYTASGYRKYLNCAERNRVLVAMGKLRADQRLFALTLAWTGGRVSEVLGLMPSSFQVEACMVSIRTLKRRRPTIREVPVPPDLMDDLEAHLALSVRQRDPRVTDRRLWPWHRTTAWRNIKRVMMAVGLSGLRATPRGLRHAFGVITMQAGVPPNIRQKWLGHARPETTSIYSDACGPEEMNFAERFWLSCDQRQKTGSHERRPVLL